MKSDYFFQSVLISCGVLQCLLQFTSAAPEVDLPISARTPAVESDFTAVYQSSHPLLIGNDGTASTGGFHVWSLEGTSPLKEIAAHATGRSKLVATVYDVGKKDLILTISQPDSVLHLFDANGVKEIKEAKKEAIGDWSALCTWKSPESGNQYFYLFGKKQAVQYLVRKGRKSFEIIEVRSKLTAREYH